ncbi:hypothetical protein [Gloeomargarita lithophora]|nr:hypothetical protein [Gloeomargarita lithophora]
MSDVSPIPVYPGSELLGQYPVVQGSDQVYGTPDFLPRVMDFYHKYLGQPQELDARGLNLAEHTIMPQLAQISWVLTRTQNQTVIYHRLGLTPVGAQQQEVGVMGANQDKILVQVGQNGYKTLICIGQKAMPQPTPLTP